MTRHGDEIPSVFMSKKENKTKRHIGGAVRWLSFGKGNKKKRRATGSPLQRKDKTRTPSCNHKKKKKGQKKNLHFILVPKFGNRVVGAGRWKCYFGWGGRRRILSYVCVCVERAACLSREEPSRTTRTHIQETVRERNKERREPKTALQE
jgi:hypothetical protein